MKKVIAALLIGAMVMASGCAKKDEEMVTMNVLIEEGEHYKIFQSPETGALYFQGNGARACMMVNDKGEPMKYRKGMEAWG